MPILAECREPLAQGVMKFHPFGLPYTLVTREKQGDELVWNYPKLGEVRMQRICRLPASRSSTGGNRV